LADLAARAGRPRSKRDRWVGGALSLATHVAIFLVLIWAWVPPPQAPDPAPIVVSLVAEPKPEPPAPPAPKAPKPARKPSPRPKKVEKPRVVARRSPEKPPPPRRIAHLAPSHADFAPRHPAAAPSNGEAEVSDAELAAAAGAESGGSGGSGGGGGGSCDMARRLQNALRRDPLVQAAVAQARAGGFSGKAIRVWNGDWVQSNGEDGRGLSAVREAITWEVAFAPKACRSEAVHGLIQISLNEAGSTRLVMGAGEWRWSDLLLLHSYGGR
jgi:hypothetical protein